MLGHMCTNKKVALRDSKTFESYLMQNWANHHDSFKKPSQVILPEVHSTFFQGFNR
jgi:hypothetical protein